MMYLKVFAKFAVMYIFAVILYISICNLNGCESVVEFEIDWITKNWQSCLVIVLIVNTVTSFLYYKFTRGLVRHE